jgi:hypothetical protein
MDQMYESKAYNRLVDEINSGKKGPVHDKEFGTDQWFTIRITDDDVVLVYRYNEENEATNSANYKPKTQFQNGKPSSTMSSFPPQQQQRRSSPGAQNTFMAKRPFQPGTMISAEPIKLPEPEIVSATSVQKVSIDDHALIEDLLNEGLELIPVSVMNPNTFMINDEVWTLYGRLIKVKPGSQ